MYITAKNGYGLDENEYTNLINLLYGYEEYFYYNKNEYYEDYKKVLLLIEQVINDDHHLSQEYKNAILGWYIFFKNSKRHLAISDIAISITDDCQLKCKHCYDQSNKRNKTYMSYDMFLELFTKHIKYSKNFVHYNENENPKLVYLLGGEPTLNKDLYKIIKYLNFNNICVILETNGINVDNDLIQLISSYKNNKVTISIDGMYDTHDYIRGIGTFNKSLKTIKKCINAGITTSTNFVVNSHNYKDIVEYKKFFKSIGVSRCNVMRYINQNNNFIFPLTKEQEAQISEHISYTPEVPCNVGTQTIITSSGGWRCCGKLSIKEIANYITDTEEEFIKKIKLFTLIFRGVPVYCFDCKLVNSCQGGQVCSQYKETNMFNIVDLTCLKNNCKQQTSKITININDLIKI